MSTPSNPVVDTDLTTKGDDKKTEENDPRQGLPSTVRVSEGNKPLNLDTTKRTDPKGQYIQYIGVGTVRDMGPAEWAAAHVDSDEYFQWNYFNHKRIPRSAFSDEQLQYLLRVDDRFKVINLDEDGNVIEDTPEK